jgi:uncharacterized protein (TIGR02246 family)
MYNATFLDLDRPNWEKRMKNPSLIALAGLAISFAVPAFAQQQDTVDAEIAEQIRALATKYDEAFNKNDAVAVAALITEDAMWTTPHGTLSGRQAIQKDYEDRAFRGYHCNNVSTKIDQVNKFGDDVEAIGTWSCTFQWSGDTKHVKGHFTWIIVREGDNSQIRADIYDESAPY